MNQTMQKNTVVKMTARLAGAVAGALFASFTAFAAEPAYDTLIAHRGESVDAPENTLPAYRTAVERGFGFECDVYLSKDGRVFTFHDQNLTRTTAGANTKKCADVTWAELETVDVGSWGKWKGSKFAGTRPALLEEVLALARDGRRIYVEVKPGPEIVPHIKKVFDAQTTATPQNVLFISFNARTCKELKAQMPAYKVYWLTVARQRGGDKRPVTSADIVKTLTEIGADGVDCCYDPAVVSADFIRSIRDAGFEFHVWTVDDLANAREAFRRGAQTVTTNCAKKLLDEHRRTEVPAAVKLDSATVQRHAALARRAAAEGMALLKNDGVLPLAPGHRLAVFDLSEKYLPGGGGSSNVKAVRIADIPSGLAEAGFVIAPESRETAVLILGRRSSEGRDNSDAAFDLSDRERETLAQLKADGFGKIVVVCNCGHAINLAPLADDPAVGAILWTWYPGGEGGAAVGDILSGKVNPSGRLADTLARAVADWPSNDGFRLARGAVPYEEGIFVGYRYFETIPGAKEKVVYPFGHGLSYTDFRLQTSDVRSLESEVLVNVRVTNTGKVPGRRAVLCYTSVKGGAAQHPAIELRAYAKTRLLQPGESETLPLAFAKRDLAYFDEDGTSGQPGAWVLDRGVYEVFVGGSVRDVEKAGSFEVAAAQVLETPGFKLKADVLARRLNADGTYATLPLAYPTRLGRPGRAACRTDAVETPAVTLDDVADGRATLDELLDQMTFKEMTFLLYGHPKVDPSGTGSIGASEKFGISAAQTCDGPAGIRRSVESTYFPCAALLASSFDPALLREVGEALGDEAVETDFDILLAPGLCIHRHPLCGRNFEYFSEDPLVAGVSAAQYVKGVQSRGVGATLKHFAGNNRETTRKYELDIVSERAFREIYLRGFERAVKEAQPWAIMTAYNGVNGYNCSEHYGLLTGILRAEWGFEGLVMTDWHTTVPLWREVAAGNDVKMPNDRCDKEDPLVAEGFGTDMAQAMLERDYLTVDAVRESAKRVCRLILKTRRFAREHAARAAAAVGGAAK